MIWNYTDKASLKMKNFKDEELFEYLSKISDENLYSYNVYQVEEGKNLFEKIDGDKDTIMGIPIKKLKRIFKGFKMLILVWFIVCIIFAFVNLILGELGACLRTFCVTNRNCTIYGS